MNLRKPSLLLMLSLFLSACSGEPELSTASPEARRFYEEVMNRKNLNAMDELCAPDFVDHTAMPGQAPGVKGVKDNLRVAATR